MRNVGRGCDGVSEEKDVWSVITSADPPTAWISTGVYAIQQVQEEKLQQRPPPFGILGSQPQDPPQTPPPPRSESLPKTACNAQPTRRRGTRLPRRWIERTLTSEEQGTPHALARRRGAKRTSGQYARTKNIERQQSTSGTGKPRMRESRSCRPLTAEYPNPPIHP